MDNLLRQLEVLPNLLGQHVVLTAIALVVGLLVSLPLGVLCSTNKSLRSMVLPVASVIQTVPSLALLALAYTVLALLAGPVEEALGWRVNVLGFWPAIIALTLYSILPILRNTVTGMAQVDASLKEAANGLGMTRAQRILRVELPLAMPVILAGVRTATVWVVGIATLSTPIGQSSLGDYIFKGLQTQNLASVLTGVVAAAALALILDGLIGWLEAASAKGSKPTQAVAAALLVVVVATGFAAQGQTLTLVEARTASGTGPPTDRSPSGSSGKTLVVGSKTFTEQYILAGVIERLAEDAGYTVEQKQGLGSNLGFQALSRSNIDVFVDYTGTIWANYMKRDGSAPGWDVLNRVTGWLAADHGVRCLGPLGFENAYALAMRRDDAQARGITTIVGLAENADTLKLGSDYEFFDRPEWFKLRDTYALDFDELVSLDSTFMYEAAARGDVDVITAFSSDGRIAAFDLAVLDDTRQAFPPYDAVLMISPRFANDPVLAEALRPMVRSIDVELMRQANQMVDVDGEPIAVAVEWLHEQIIAGGPGS